MYKRMHFKSNNKMSHFLECLLKNVLLTVSSRLLRATMRHNEDISVSSEVVLIIYIRCLHNWLLTENALYVHRVTLFCITSSASIGHVWHSKGPKGQSHIPVTEAKESQPGGQLVRLSGNWHNGWTNIWLFGMVSLAWHLVTFALPQRCNWRVGGRRKKKKTRVEEYNCVLTIHCGPISGSLDSTVDSE